MPALNALNVWGRASASPLPSYDPQRTDLWILDLDSAIAAITQVLSDVDDPRATAVLGALPLQNDIPFYARSVDLPTMRTATSATRRDNSLLLAPGYDEPASTTVVTFIHELTTTDATYLGSAIWALMEGWRALVRAGQPVNPDSQELELTLNEAAAAGTLTITYAFPLYAHLLTPSADGQSLTQAGRYQVYNAWPSEVQVLPLNHKEGRELEIRVTFACDGATPV